ncbi:APH(3') family aminoglycoside O-phosphotransferase [Nocardia sp. NPDC059240]|uniref:APH(3') family aminoglycoside O-phosphotransferase n=1 Tax=Nocardia sp. NPDC059240 TaxID=3346786 RepID=UPI0036CA72B9
MVTTGCSGAAVWRSPDGRSYAKTASSAAGVGELQDERDRLGWLRTVPVGSPEVLDWIESDGKCTLITSALPGVPASEFPASAVESVTRELVRFLAVLHGIPVSSCPFDGRLDLTIPRATANVAAGLVDEDDFDDVRRGRAARDLLDALVADQPHARALEASDLAVCHGDFCLPNVLLDPETLTVTGILDVGRLGVADRHFDLALLTRSIASAELNPSFDSALADAVIERTGADPWRIEYYRLLDEFF